MVVAAWGATARDSEWVDNIAEEITGGEEPRPAIYCLGVVDSGAPQASDGAVGNTGFPTTSGRYSGEPTDVRL